jgi:squalene synthase HpnC
MMQPPAGREAPRCCVPGTRATAVGHAAQALATPTLPAELEDLEPGMASPAQARQAVRALCGHYENFSLASFFLPPRLRAPLRSIYAFARFSDDLADEDNGLSAQAAVAGHSLPELRRQRLLHWVSLVEKLPETADRHPILHCLWEDAQSHALPLEECRKLLEAFVQDQDPPDFPHDQAVLDYCRLSAAPVGRLLLALNGVGARHPRWTRILAASDALCAGLQLANFWQDLSRDLPQGRLYIPRQRLQEHGFPANPHQLVAGRGDAQALMEALLDWAEALLRQGRELSDLVGGRFGLEIRLYAGGGMEIVRKSRALGQDLLHARPQVKALDKVRIGCSALWG